MNNWIKGITSSKMSAPSIAEAMDIAKKYLKGDFVRHTDSFKNSDFLYLLPKFLFMWDMKATQVVGVTVQILEKA